MRRSASSRARRFRCFFATDVHGSERCFKKFLAAAKAYEADVLILGGDVGGKAIVPIVCVEEGTYRFKLHGQAVETRVDGLQGAVARMQDAGLYPMVLAPDEVTLMEQDVAHRTAVFERALTEQLTRWCELAAERLRDSVRCIITPGNDDMWSIDEVLRRADRVECPERECVDVGPLALASLGNTNRTPWDTDREFDEPELARQIDELLAGVSSADNLVFNFHVPPYGSGLDTATKLDDRLSAVVANGHPVQIPVGSTAVREAIERYRPSVGLHGHIHESAGVWRHRGAVCLNPGSDYGSGVLKGALVQFDASGKFVDYLLTTG